MEPINATGERKTIVGVDIKVRSHSFHIRVLPLKTYALIVQRFSLNRTLVARQPSGTYACMYVRTVGLLCMFPPH